MVSFKLTNPCTDHSMFCIDSLISLTHPGTTVLWQAAKSTQCLLEAASVCKDPSSYPAKAMIDIYQTVTVAMHIPYVDTRFSCSRNVLTRVCYSKDFFVFFCHVIDSDLCCQQHNYFIDVWCSQWAYDGHEQQGQSSCLGHLPAHHQLTWRRTAPSPGSHSEGCLH